jgi:hypothetical protein
LRAASPASDCAKTGVLAHCARREAHAKTTALPERLCEETAEEILAVDRRTKEKLIDPSQEFGYGGIPLGTQPENSSSMRTAILLPDSRQGEVRTLRWALRDWTKQSDTKQADREVTADLSEMFP